MQQPRVDDLVYYVYSYFLGRWWICVVHHSSRVVFLLRRLVLVLVRGVLGAGDVRAGKVLRPGAWHRPPGEHHRGGPRWHLRGRVRVCGLGCGCKYGCKYGCDK